MPRKIKQISTYDLSKALKANEDTQNASAYNKQENLYAWYRFEDDISSSGNVEDSQLRSDFKLVPASSRPTLSLDSPSSIATVSGFSKRSSAFNTDVVRAQDKTLFPLRTGTAGAEAAFSLSIWVNIDEIGTRSQYLVSKYGIIDAKKAYALEITTAGEIAFTIYNGAAFSQVRTNDSIGTNRWYHIVVTFSGTVATQQIQLYVDGVRVPYSKTTESVGGGAFTVIAETDSLFAIGNDESDPHSGNNVDTRGKISEVALWTTLLDQSDIKTLYNFKDAILYRTASGFVNLPPRVLLRQRDNATGSYPTVMRMGDKGRTGAYNRTFEDNYTINFGKKIKDVFEIKNRVGGVLGFSRDIDSSKWTHSKGMEIRQELVTGDTGATIRKTALVFSGGGLAGKRRIQTKNKIKNPRIKIDLTIGPYQEDRTVLKFGLGLSDGTATDDLKIQASTNGSDWVDIKTIQNNISTLLQSAFTRGFRSTDLVKRRSVQVDLYPTDFPFGNNAFYLRIIQESVSSNNVVVWAMSSIEIDYHDEENISYPLMVNVDSFVGKKIVSSSVTAPHLNPTLKGPGRSISGISDVHLSFTPGEKLLPFIDNSHFFNDTSIFFNQGTSPDVIPGFSSPVSNKTIIEVDLSPSEQTTFGLDTRATHESTGDGGGNRGPRLETDATKKQQLMVYWNKDLRRWEKIAQGVSGNVVAKQDEGFTPLRNMIHSGALGFSGIGMCSTGSDVTLANQSPVNQDALLSYARPTSTFGFPFEGKYEATASQFIKARDIGITKPFLLEKCSISFDSKFEFASNQFDSGSRAYSMAVANSSGGPSSRTLADNQKVYIPTFFMLRQSKETLDVEYEYEIEDVGIRASQKRIVSIPDSAVHLSTAPTPDDIISVEKSRELITYGQMTLFVSGVANTAGSGDGRGSINAQVDIDTIINNGLGRDTIVDILSVTGQTNFNIGSSGQLAPITSSFNINFPCRLSPKINNTCQTILVISNSGGTDTIGALILGNTLGGRGSGDIQSSARAIVNGYGSTKLGEEFLHFAQDNSKAPISLIPPSAETIDLASPYIILPDDELVMGWQYPMTTRIANAAPGKSDTFLNTMSLYGNSKLKLIGSLIKNKKEYHEGLNQNISSDAVHEIIGAETPIDQFKIEKQSENKGNFYDTNVVVTNKSPVGRIGSETSSKMTTLVSNAGKASGKIRLGSPFFVSSPGIQQGLAIDQIIGLTGSEGARYAAKAGSALNVSSPSNGGTFELFGNANTYAEALYTLISLQGLIFLDPETTDIFTTSIETAYNSSTSWSVTLNITQKVGGVDGNLPISFEPDNILRQPARLSDFTGGADGEPVRSNSFSRNVQLEDEIRIYTDSTGSAGAFDIAGGISKFGIMQTATGITPKYYFNSKKYGHFSDFMDQGKDSKFSQVIGSRVSAFKGSALQSPVEIIFVSGTNENTIGIKQFGMASPQFSENKSRTSALTGSFMLHTGSFS